MKKFGKIFPRWLAHTAVFATDDAGLLHCANGPAMTYADNSEVWFIHGHAHRADGPAITCNTASRKLAISRFAGMGVGTLLQVWIYHGKLHRADGPAVVWCTGDKAWYVSGKRHRDDGPAVTKHGGALTKWYRHGQLHRADGPAVQRPCGTLMWYIRDKLHRAGAPAVEASNGRREWRRNGQLHNTRGPALIAEDGTVEWHQDGRLHRDGGPARMTLCGKREWFCLGMRHRDGGAPAVEWPNGACEWWVFGQRRPAPGGSDADRVTPDELALLVAVRTAPPASAVTPARVLTLLRLADNVRHAHCLTLRALLDEPGAPDMWDWLETAPREPRALAAVVPPETRISWVRTMVSYDHELVQVGLRFAHECMHAAAFACSDERLPLELDVHRNLTRELAARYYASINRLAVMINLLDEGAPRAAARDDWAATVLSDDERALLDAVRAGWPDSPATVRAARTLVDAATNPRHRHFVAVRLLLDAPTEPYVPSAYERKGSHLTAPAALARDVSASWAVNVGYHAREYRRALFACTAHYLPPGGEERASAPWADAELVLIEHHAAEATRARALWKTYVTGSPPVPGYEDPPRTRRAPVVSNAPPEIRRRLAASQNIKRG